MAQGKDHRELQKRLGYKFNNESYIRCALVHSSYANEQKSRGDVVQSNERLEFLGDAILQAVISEHLFINYQKRREGALTRLRQQLVCEKMLAKIAAEIDLGDFIWLGHGEEIKDCRKSPKILADCIEAIIAGIYLDMGMGISDGFKNVIISLFGDKIAEIANSQPTDYKSMLQQLAEQDGASELEYRIEQTGTSDAPCFKATAYINNNIVGVGVAGKKKEAEMIAAGKALELFGIIE